MVMVSAQESEFLLPGDRKPLTADSRSPRRGYHRAAPGRHPLDAAYLTGIRDHREDRSPSQRHLDSRYLRDAYLSGFALRGVRQ